MQTAKRFKLKKAWREQVDYLLFLPKGYDAKSRKRWPLILFLHGAGERGDKIWTVAKHGPPKYVTEHPEFPFIVVSPQCGLGRGWSEAVLIGLLDEVVQSQAVDVSRIYLTGLSMGGYGAWRLGLAQPQRFAAIVPICGGGELLSLFLAKAEAPVALATLAIWAFHGAQDAVVPVEESRRMVEAAKRVGIKEVKLTIYPAAGHDSWTKTYHNPELYRWLLEHRRRRRKTANRSARPRRKKSR